MWSNLLRKPTWERIKGDKSKLEYEHKAAYCKGKLCPRFKATGGSCHKDNCNFRNNMID